MMDAFYPKVYPKVYTQSLHHASNVFSARKKNCTPYSQSFFIIINILFAMLWLKCCWHEKKKNHTKQRVGLLPKIHTNK